MTPDPARHALRRRPLFMPYITAVVVGVVALGILGWLAWPQPPSTVIVVRHAEKLEGPDPGLSSIGWSRAEEFAEWFAPAGVSVIYSTPTRRTMETAAPLAARLSLPVQEYDAGASDALVKEVRRLRGKTVLIVGHSNTVPELVMRLGATDVGRIGEERYGDVFIIVRSRWGRVTVVRQFQPVHQRSSRV